MNIVIIAIATWVHFIRSAIIYEYTLSNLFIFIVETILNIDPYLS